MFHIPLSAPDGFTDALKPDEEREALWFVFLGDRLRILPDEPPFPLKRSLYFGTFLGKHLFAGEVEKEVREEEWVSLRALFGRVDEAHFALAGRAMQLLEWERAHRYCGCCGAPTVPRLNERCLACPKCGHLAYPKIAPAVMALVRREEKILLARGPHFPEKFYSVLAGFVDPGETLEQCVIREVYEEVGITVQNIRYFASQPWPFSGSLMIGFVCDWAGGEIRVDPLEIEDAKWFALDALPQLPPPLSLARLLIDA